MNKNLTHFLERDNSQWVYDGDFSIDYNWEHKNGLWTETNEETYWDQLGCVPPIQMNRNSFMVGEPYTHNEKGFPVYASFVKFRDRYFGKYDIIKNFNVENYKLEILNQFAMEVV